MIFEAFESIPYMDTESVDLIRDYGSYILGTYTINYGDRPDLVAYKLYGNPKLFWLILYINNIFDPFHGWKKDTNAIYESASQKYADMGGTEQTVYLVTPEGERYYDLVESENGDQHWYHKGDIHQRHVQYVGTLMPVPVHVAELEEDDNLQTIHVVDPNDIRSFMEEH